MLLRVACAAAGAAIALSAYCGGAPGKDAKPNLFPINVGQGQLMRSVPHGKAYMAGQPGFEFWVVHVWGNNSYGA